MVWTRKRTYAAVVMTVCALLALWLIWSYFHRPPIQLSDGRVARDMSVAEVGLYAAPELTPLRKAYLESLQAYQEMAMRPVADEAEVVAQQVEGVLIEALKDEALSRPAMDALPASALADLSSRVALILRRAAGMPLEEYVRQLDPGARLVVPPNLVFEEFPNLDRPDGPPPPAAEVRQAFEQLYLRMNDYESGNTTLAGWAADSEGLVVGLEILSTNHQKARVLNERWETDHQRKVFKGHLTQGALLFHAPPETWSDLRAKHDQLVRCQISMIVEDRGGDRYPLFMEFYYDPSRQRWWPVGVARLVSVRMAVAPALVL